MKYYLLVVITLFASNIYGQRFIPYHSSTVQEGIRRGQADLYRGQGQYLRDLGYYENLTEEARSRQLDNWEKWNQTRERIQADRNERLYGEDYLDRKEKLLDMAERRHELQQRERSLQASGVLPMPPQPKAVINGKEYISHRDWRNNARPEYMLMQSQRAERHVLERIEELNAERRKKEAYAFEGFWRSLDSTAKTNYKLRRSRAALFGDPSPSPRFEFKSIDWQLDAAYETLDRIRKQQKVLRELISRRERYTNN